MKSAIPRMRIAIFGLSITSAWGNGHATTYRSLVRALAKLGHQVEFYERQQSWYAAHRDLPDPEYCRVTLYENLASLERHVGGALDADLTIVGSYVPEGVRLAEWALSRARGLTAFYDIDTPVTLANLDRGACPYLTPALVSQFDLYLSFTGGPILERLQRRYGASLARPLYCSVDPDYYRPLGLRPRFDLGYLGTYSDDRQPKLEQLLMNPARQWSAGRFCVAGAQYPGTLEWPANVERIEHLAPADHCKFYNEQRFTLNVTRADMVASGYSPSVRLFEAAACGVPIISDEWSGLEEIFSPGRDILIARTSADTMRFLRDLAPQDARAIGERARARVLAEHTGDHRARQLESYVAELLSVSRSSLRVCHGN
jgi:spore maturation protein CgeB